MEVVFYVKMIFERKTKNKKKKFFMLMFHNIITKVWFY